MDRHGALGLRVGVASVRESGTLVLAGKPPPTSRCGRAALRGVWLCTVRSALAARGPTTPSQFHVVATQRFVRWGHARHGPQ